MTLKVIHKTAEAWFTKADAFVRAYMADLTATSEASEKSAGSKGRKKSTSTIIQPPPIDWFYGFTSSNPFADVVLDAEDGTTMAKRRFDLWLPKAASIGTSRLSADTFLDLDAENLDGVDDPSLLPETLSGARLVAPGGKDAKNPQIYVNPRTGADLNDADRSLAILVTMLHAAILAAIGGGELETYDPKKQPKMAEKYPNGRWIVYGSKFRQVAGMLGLVLPTTGAPGKMGEAFTLREGNNETFIEAINGGEHFPEPLGAFPAPAVLAHKLRRIGKGPGEISRQRNLVCPNYPTEREAQKTTQHASMLSTRKYTDEGRNEETGLYYVNGVEFSPICGAPDCGQRLVPQMPEAIALYNEAITRIGKGPEGHARALLIAQGAIPPFWSDEVPKAETGETETDETDKAATA